MRLESLNLAVELCKYGASINDDSVIRRAEAFSDFIDCKSQGGGDMPIINVVRHFSGNPDRPSKSPFDSHDLKSMAALPECPLNWAGVQGVIGEVIRLREHIRRTSKSPRKSRKHKSDAEPSLDAITGASQ